MHAYNNQETRVARVAKEGGEASHGTNQERSSIVAHSSGPSVKSHSVLRQFGTEGL